MEQSYLLREGLVLMVVGMLIVYAFLSVMIWVMSFSKFFERFAYLMPDPAPPAPPRSKAADADDGARVALAIAAAQRR